MVAARTSRKGTLALADGTQSAEEVMDFVRKWPEQRWYLRISLGPGGSTGSAYDFKLLPCQRDDTVVGYRRQKSAQRSKGRIEHLDLTHERAGALHEQSRNEQTNWRGF